VNPGSRSGEILLKYGLVRPAELRLALKQQLALRLESLYALKDAQVRFRPPRRLRTAGEGQALSPHDFLYGRPRSRLKPRAPCRPERAAQREAALALLGVGDDAKPEDIRMAFRSLARNAHPDQKARLGAIEQRTAAARFARLSAAYHSLIR
jgi:DnaJ-domain-containing protein 1